MEELLLTPEPPKELIDPSWNLLDVLGPRNKEIFLHYQRHHLNLLVKEGIIIVKEGCSLYINDQGFITATGCEGLTEEQLRKPAPDIYPLYFNEQGYITAVGCRSLTEEELRAPAPLMISGPGRKDKAEAKESPLAARIMKDLATAPPLICPAWKTILKTLNEMPPSQRTAKALVTLLQPAIDKEEEHWETLAIMRASLDIEEIVKIDFGDVWDVIYALAEPEKRDDDTTCDEWHDLHSIVTALNTIHDGIQGKYWGGTPWYTYDIPRGIKRYELIWKSVIDTLKEGIMGARMQAYVDALLESSSPGLHD
ncbi:hypothetical protein GGI43DRAFT_385689 [Trichoderma evansii]